MFLFRAHSRVVVLTFCLASSVCCSPDEEERTTSTTTPTSELAEWMLEREFTIGSVEDTWEIFSETGHPLATIKAPSNIIFHAADNTHAWATETDDLDVPYIVRYQVLRQ